MRISGLAALTLCLVACSAPTTRPSPEAPARSSAALHPDAIAMEPEHWDIDAWEGTFGTHRDRPAMRLRGGFAFPRGIELEDGIIEYDFIAEQGVVFTGAVWRVHDEDDYEKLYLRPFLSGSREATQYTPVFNHGAAWQLYHGPDYNQPVRFRPGRWTSVRIVLSGGRAEMFVDDMETPLFTVNERHEPGRLPAALFVEPIPEAMGKAGVWFSNVRFTPATAPALNGAPPDETRPNRVPAWRVSKAFSSSDFAGATKPEVAEAAVLDAEPSGLLNLARLHPTDATHDTAMACATVTADAASRRRLRFGFSERARIWWNGELLYDGDDTWHSRDITFQGVIGLFDAVWPAIRPGDNELCIAVTENTDMRGGWGLIAAFEDLEGLRLTPAQ